MTNEATDFEITIYGFRDSDHMIDWLKDCRRAGEAFAKRHRQRRARASVRVDCLRQRKPQRSSTVQSRRSTAT